MSRGISDHIRANVWAIVACFVAAMGVAVVAGASEGDPHATKSASVSTQIKKLKRKLASVEQRLAAVEGKPAPTIPTSLPPSGPAGGELIGSYPNPDIGVLNGLQLAQSSTPAGGITFGPDFPLFRSVNGDLRFDATSASGINSLWSIEGLRGGPLNQSGFLGESLEFDSTDGGAFMQIGEQSPAPANPSTGRVRIYARDNGGGLTQLVVRFADGTVVVLGTEAP
jgi:hypothetical protein